MPGSSDSTTTRAATPATPDDDRGSRPPPPLAILGRRAATLFERLEGCAEPTEADPELESRLDLWARVVARGDRRRLDRRLRWDGLDPGRAARALASDAAASAKTPEWLHELGDVVEASRASEADTALREARRRFGEAIEGIPFLELWLPWLAVARRRLEGRLPARAPASDEAIRDLELWLLREISRCGELAALERLEILREETPEGCRARFVAAALHDPVTVLYAAAPVLARQLVDLLEQWVEAVGELIRRLDRDLPRVAALLELAPGALGPVVAVEPGLSDRHAGGRTVHVLRFRSGRRVVYKPRSVAAEALLERLAAFCRSADPEIAPAAVRAVDLGGYGWMEFAEPAAVDATDLESWSQRAGSLLCLAHCLRARDLHAENVVATARGPAIIDAEMLLQPVVARWTSGEDPADDGPDRGHCLATGLLAQVRPDGTTDDDLGGLRVTRPSGTRRVWRDVGTDAVRVEEEAFTGEPLPNCPRVDGDPARLEDHAAALVEGFRRSARLVVDRREELLAPDGPLGDDAAGVEVRFLVRASDAYGRVLRLARTPRNQRSGLAGSWLVEALLTPWTEGDSPPMWWPLAAEERRSLERGDVPRFALPAGATAMPTADGPAELFERSGIEAARRRIAELDEQEIQRQVSFVRAVLEPAPEPRRFGTPDAPFREVAHRIAAHLADAIDRGEGPAGLDLADGLAGPLLVLAAAARDRPELERSRDRALERMVAELATVPTEAGERPGGWSGLGSIVWSLCQVSVLHPDPRLLDGARRLATILDRPSGDLLDLDRGAAGAVLALLCLHRTTGEDRPLEAAIRWGDALVAAQRPTGSAHAAWPNVGGLVQPGWAHGAAGIVRALAALADATGTSRFLVAAAAGICHERSLFDAERGNWPVLLTDGGERRERRWMVAVCRGAPGIALSRLYLPDALSDRALAEERIAALRTTATTPPAELDTLCCGTLGRASVLWSAARRLDDPSGSLEEAARKLTTGALERAGRRGRFHLRSGVAEPSGPPPGFLKGLAGVAWHLLRLEDDGLPDVLALELPGEEPRR